ncbi:MAG: hypothetical protein AAB295_11575 [Chloroflexota bacterium]
MPFQWVLNQDWLTFDTLLMRSAEVTIEEKIERLVDGALAAQSTEKAIKKRVRQLEAARKRQRGSDEPKKKAQPNRKGLRDFMDAVRRKSKKGKEAGGGGR